MAPCACPPAPSSRANRSKSSGSTGSLLAAEYPARFPRLPALLRWGFSSCGSTLAGLGTCCVIALIETSVRRASDRVWLQRSSRERAYQDRGDRWWRNQRMDDRLIPCEGASGNRRDHADRVGGDQED